MSSLSTDFLCPTYLVVYSRDVLLEREITACNILGADVALTFACVLVLVLPVLLQRYL